MRTRILAVDIDGTLLNSNREIHPRNITAIHRATEHGIRVTLASGRISASVRQFNQRASALDNTVVVCVSADLPFAQSRFCGAEGLATVQTASTFRSNFGAQYGVTLSEGVLAGLLARAVVVLDEKGTVIHSQLVAEIAHEPDYDAALHSLG